MDDVTADEIDAHGHQSIDDIVKESGACAAYLATAPGAISPDRGNGDRNSDQGIVNVGVGDFAEALRYPAAFAKAVIRNAHDGNQNQNQGYQRFERDQNFLQTISLMAQ